MNYEELCRNCDNFIDDEIVRIIDKPSSTPFSDDEVSHWDTAYKCTWNGLVSSTIKGLHEGNCRCESDEFRKHTWLLNDAQDIVNEHLKERYEKGEITSPYECGSHLDVIQIFDYSLEYWNENTVNQELFDLIIKIKVQVKDADVARRALRFIAQYIIETNSLLWWSRATYHGNLKYVLQTHFPLENKPLNYDYLRYVINSDIGAEK